MKPYNNVDEYLDNYSGETREKLESIRETIKKLVPNASEVISYGIPTFKLNGHLVHYAGYTNHIGFYPGSAPISEFEKELVDFKTSRGTIQFSIDKPLPLELIEKIVLLCVKRNQAKL